MSFGKLDSLAWSVMVILQLKIHKSLHFVHIERLQ
jgi:hypothetical protein